MKLRSKKGFTLIELMIVVAIIGILAAIAIPNFLKFQAKSRTTEARTNLGAIFTGQTSFYGEANTYGTFANIGWGPTGTPRYQYAMGVLCALAAPVAPGQMGKNLLGDGLLPTWTGNLNNAMDNGSLATAVPPDNVAMPDPASFVAGAAGNIDNDNTDRLDAWTINKNRVLINTDSDV
ncbi:MAG TPA: prepilin-type N-terminal cleavage/methylation domain-containing protein [Candidatus Methylomirabilis sp.]|nr:prepilin-type N-terminal cleavage/methylation domain-containing protein [Candidatus Methylomirabilis sp.]